ncbi:MAG: chemotaxis protein CheW [Gammaproteobacteria bacterium]|nr:chemotaxis protein CheW [Gammaproteobacteria bacterium]
MKVNNHHVGIDVKEVVEVIPRVSLSAAKEDDRHDHSQGNLSYHGKFVPVFDLSYLLALTSTEQSLSSRIIVSQAPSSCKGNKIGLIAAHLTSIMTIPVEQKNWLHAEKLMNLVQQDDMAIHLLSVERIMDCYYAYGDLNMLPKIGAPI